MFFKQELGFSPQNFFGGGSSFESLHFFENHRTPWDVINDRSVTLKLRHCSGD